jgi:hypothetical protein
MKGKDGGTQVAKVLCLAARRRTWKALCSGLACRATGGKEHAWKAALGRERRRAGELEPGRRVRPRGSVEGRLSCQLNTCKSFWTTIT